MKVPFLINLGEYDVGSASKQKPSSMYSIFQKVQLYVGIYIYTYTYMNCTRETSMLESRGSIHYEYQQIKVELPMKPINIPLYYNDNFY